MGKVWWWFSSFWSMETHLQCHKAFCSDHCDDSLYVGSIYLSALLARYSPPVNYGLTFFREIFLTRDLWNTTMERFTIFQGDISIQGSGKYNGNVLPFFREIFLTINLRNTNMARITIFQGNIPHHGSVKDNYGNVYHFSVKYFSLWI